MVNTIKLKERGVWVCGTAASDTSLYRADLKGPTAIVIGEGDGMNRLVSELRL